MTEKENVMLFIANLRRTRKLKQDEMGEFLGVSGRTVGRWERGTSIPTALDLINICRVFDVPLEDVFNNGSISDLSTERTVEDRTAEVKTNPINKAKEDPGVLLFLIHVLSILLGYVAGVIGQAALRISGAVYVILISVLMYMNREDRLFMKTMIIYSLILGLVLFGNLAYSLGLPFAAFVKIPDSAIVNTSVYAVWIVFALYNLMKYREDR